MSPDPFELLNFRVSEYQTYYVTQNIDGTPLLIHNARCGVGANSTNNGSLKAKSGDLEEAARKAREFNPKPGKSVAPNSGASNVNAAEALRAKLSGLQKAQNTAASSRTLPDGRIRYYGPETAASTPGRTRGASFVTEWDPKTGTVRQWMESYDQAGNLIRVHPKSINGQQVFGPHYPPTGRELGQ